MQVPRTPSLRLDGKRALVNTEAASASPPRRWRRPGQGSRQRAAARPVAEVVRPRAAGGSVDGVARDVDVAAMRAPSRRRRRPSTCW